MLYLRTPPQKKKKKKLAHILFHPPHPLLQTPDCRLQAPVHGWIGKPSCLPYTPTTVLSALNQLTGITAKITRK